MAGDAAAACGRAEHVRLSAVLELRRIPRGATEDFSDRRPVSHYGGGIDAQLYDAQMNAELEFFPTECIGTGNRSIRRVFLLSAASFRIINRRQDSRK
jgi:hypothetical protein